MKDGLTSVLLRGALARCLKGFLLVVCAFAAGGAYAHGVSEGDQSFVESARGVNIVPYMYLGAKHMVTGYDHLLFLFGVIFFLYRLKDVGKYVTLFAIGHSVTLLAGVMLDIKANAFIIDAIIGLSVVYKALDNLGAFKTVLGFEPNPKVAVLVFGFFHGFGLATKIQELSISKDGLFTNLVSFNIGVEFGQLLALSLILLVMTLWRQTASFQRSAIFANGVLMTAGLVLAGWQLSGYFYPGV
ncbi:HupE/UreJ family protein [Pseudomonas sp. XS1P51]